MTGRGSRGLRRVAALVIAASAVSSASCSDGGPDQEAFCAAVEVAPSLRSVFVGFTNRSPTDLDRSLTQASDAYQRIGRNAPEEIRSETEEIVEVVEVIITAVRDHPDDNEAAAAAIQMATDRVPTLDESTTAFATYAAENCDLVLNPPDEMTSTTRP